MGVSAQADLAARCQPIELLVTDVDGVLDRRRDRA